MKSDDLLAVVAPRTKPLRTVYPLYIASRVMRGLRAAVGDAEGIISTIGQLKTLGNGSYSVNLFDDNRTEYRVTVEVVS